MERAPWQLKLAGVSLLTNAQNWGLHGNSNSNDVENKIDLCSLEIDCEQGCEAGFVVAKDLLRNGLDKEALYWGLRLTSCPGNLRSCCSGQPPLERRTYSSFTGRNGRRNGAHCTWKYESATVHWEQNNSEVLIDLFGKI